MEPTPIPQGNNEIKSLFAEKGELITQLEIAQGKLQQVNMRLGQLLNLPVQQPTGIPQAK